jgi:hypothetical protein
MGVNHIDPKLLRDGSLQALHAARQSMLHIASEYGGHTPTIMETLTADDPYGFMIFPQVLADGRVKIPILTTREEVRRGYEMTWANTKMLEFKPLIELRGAWYLLQEALNTVHLRDIDTVVHGESVALITTSNLGVPGITGELVWARRPRAELGRGSGLAVDQDASEGERRRQLIELHDQYLRMLLAHDVEGVLSVMHESVQSPVRDYVNDTGALISLESLDAHAAHFRAFFQTYEVKAADVLDRVAQEWYLFAETRLSVRRRADGAELAFHTAEIFAPAHDGRFIARIGHGTDPA